LHAPLTQHGTYYIGACVPMTTVPACTLHKPHTRHRCSYNFLINCKTIITVYTFTTTFFYISLSLFYPLFVHSFTAPVLIIVHRKYFNWIIIRLENFLILLRVVFRHVQGVVLRLSYIMSFRTLGSKFRCTDTSCIFAVK